MTAIYISLIFVTFYIMTIYLKYDGSWNTMASSDKFVACICCIAWPMAWIGVILAVTYSIIASISDSSTTKIAEYLQKKFNKR